MLQEKFLQKNGFACFAKYENDLYIFYGGLGGKQDVYYRPTICTISNPALNFSADLEIDKDCVIVDNDSYRLGLIPIIEKYSAMLVENDISTFLATVNTRITTIFFHIKSPLANFQVIRNSISYLIILVKCFSVFQ